MEGMTVGLAMVIPAAAIALAVLLRHPMRLAGPQRRPSRPARRCATRPSRPVAGLGDKAAPRPPPREADGSQGEPRNPASVTATSRRTPALDGRLPAAPRAWTQ